MRFLSLVEARKQIHSAPDIYYTPRYGETAQMIDDGVWECAVDGQAFYPYIKRTVGIEGYDGYYDIVSPYGYSGVAGYGSQAEILEFREQFLERSRARGLVAEFLRSNPFDVSEEELRAYRLDKWTARQTFGVRNHADSYWARVSGRHRTAVRRARKSGIHVAFHSTDRLTSPIDSFHGLYQDTMTRVGADERLILGPQYFESLSIALNGSGSIVAEAHVGGELCAAAIFMRHGSRVHYHLAGSTNIGRRLGATNAIIDSVAQTYLADSDELHLGGGLVPLDGLESFKRSVATEARRVYLCRTVVNTAVYDDLVRLTDTCETEYFPAYRGRRQR